MTEGLKVAPTQVPPLESGDHLNQAEFHARYLPASHLKKAELIEGIVFMPSPVSAVHSQAHGDLITWLRLYAAEAGGAELGLNATLILDDRNELQPDALLRKTAKEECPSWVDADGFFHGAPELVAEVAVTSASMDLREKFEAYQRNGISEYLVWQVLDKKLTWWRLRGGVYQPLKPDADGILQSEIFPGLKLDLQALLQGNMNQVFERLRT